MAEVYYLKRGSDTELDATNQYRITAEVRAGREGIVGTTPAPDVEFEDLYADSAQTQPVHQVRRLLFEVADRLEKAQLALAENDEIDADDQINIVQSTLPEVFIYRSVSEGLSALIVATHYSLLNRRGEFLGADRLGVLRKVMLRLRDTPFLSFDAALELIDDLENEGFNVNPPEADALGELLASDD